MGVGIFKLLLSPTLATQITSGFRQAADLPCTMQKLYVFRYIELVSTNTTYKHVDSCNEIHICMDILLVS